MIRAFVVFNRANEAIHTDPTRELAEAFIQHELQWNNRGAAGWRVVEMVEVTPANAVAELARDAHYVALGFRAAQAAASCTWPRCSRLHDEQCPTTLHHPV